MHSVYQHKRGATLSLTGAITAPVGEVLPSFVGWIPSGQVRLLDDSTVSDLEVTWIDITLGAVKVYKKDTTGWPLGVAEIDLRFVNAAGEVMFTSTQVIQIVKQITRV